MNDEISVIAASGETIDIQRGFGGHLPRVTLADIVFALETQTDDSTAYLERSTGTVHVITEQDERALHRGDDEVPAWQKRIVQVARALAAGSDDYVQLPTSRDVDELGLMESFCLEHVSEATRPILFDAIHGGGGPRTFRAALRRHCLLEEWERFRMRALQAIALEWCRKVSVAFDEAEIPGGSAYQMNGSAEEASLAARNGERLLDQPVYTHVTWRVKVGHVDEFLAAWNDLGDLFPDLEHPPIEVTLIRRADDPSVFHSIGSWGSLADAQAISDNERAIDALARISSVCAEGMPAVYEVVRQIRTA